MPNRKRLLIAAITGMSILLIFSFAPALVVKYQLKKQMQQLGADQVSIESLYLNPWTGDIEISGLSATASGQPDFKLGYLNTAFSYRALWNKRLQMTRLQLADVELHVQRVDQQWRLGPLRLPMPDSTPDDNPQQTPSQWYAGLDGFTLDAINGSLTDAGMSHQLRIEHAELQRLHQWTPQQQTRLELQGRINDSPIVIATQGTPLATQPQLELKIQLQQLALAPLTSPWLKGLRGKLSSDLTLRLQQFDNGFKLEQSGTVSLTEAGFSQADLTLESQQIDWQGHAQQQLTAGTLTQASSDSQLHIQQFSLQQAELELEEQSLRWVGQLHAQGSQHFSFNGEFNSGEARIKLPELLITNQARSWQGQIEISLTQQGLAQLVADGVLQLQELLLEQPKMRLNEQQIELKGRLETDAKQLSFTGALQTQPSRLELQQLQITTQARHWQGALGINITSAAVNSLSGDLSIGPLAVRQPQDELLIAFEQLQLNQLQRPQPNQFGAGSLQLQQLVFGDEQPLLTLDALRVSHINLSQTGVQIDSIHPGELNVRVDLDDSMQPYRWHRWLQQLTGSQSAASPPQTELVDNTAPAAPQDQPTDRDDKPYAFKLAEFALQKPSLIQITERSATTGKPGRPYKTTIDTLRIAEIDSRTEQASPFTFSARTHRFGNIELTGDFALFAEAADGHWQGAIANMELPPFSPLMQQQTGYQIHSGKLKLKTQGSLTAGQVDSRNHLLISNFIVNPADKGASGEFDAQLGMPLATAVSLLTDSDDNVELDLPITGKLDDPEFGIQSVLNIVMVKVTREAAVGYLALTLQPYGALISLTRLAVDSLDDSNIQLEAVYFEPGSAALTPQAVDYLSKLGKMLTERDGLRLKLCGQSVAADKAWLLAQRPVELTAPAPLVSLAPLAAPAPPALPTTASAAQPAMPLLLTELEQDGLRQLAEERGFAVQSHLLAQHQVKDDQLFACLADVDSQANSRPQVRLGL